MMLIFLASSQTAVDSSELSGSLTRLVVGSVWGWFAPAGRDMPRALLDIAETVLRKAAHLFNFFVFGICVTNAVRQLSGNMRRVFWASLIWCSAYAAFDELHQVFVPGRAGMWQDWLIDTAGAFLGAGAVLYVVWRRANKKRRAGGAQG